MLKQLLPGKQPSIRGANPGFVKHGEMSWLLERAHGCWSGRWKLKEYKQNQEKPAKIINIFKVDIFMVGSYCPST